MKYPRITLIIYNKKGKEVHSYHTGRKRSVKPRLDLYYKPGFRVYVKVIYKPDFQNEGEYFTKKDFLHAYRCFTEKDLLKEYE